MKMTKIKTLMCSFFILFSVIFTQESCATGPTFQKTTWDNSGIQNTRLEMNLKSMITGVTEKPKLSVNGTTLFIQFFDSFEASKILKSFQDEGRDNDLSLLAKVSGQFIAIEQDQFNTFLNILGAPPVFISTFISSIWRTLPQLEIDPSSQEYSWDEVIAQDKKIAVKLNAMIGGLSGLPTIELKKGTNGLTLLITFSSQEEAINALFFLQEKNKDFEALIVQNTKIAIKQTQIKPFLNILGAPQDFISAYIQTLLSNPSTATSLIIKDGYQWSHGGTQDNRLAMNLNAMIVGLKATPKVSVVGGTLFMTFSDAAEASNVLSLFQNKKPTLKATLNGPVIEITNDQIDAFVGGVLRANKIFIETVKNKK